MKYQYKLNNEILFETDNVMDFFEYISTKDSYVRDSVLIRLLEQSKGYIVNMGTTN